MKKMRRSAGYTQQSVADFLKIDRSTYSYYETGKTQPSVEALTGLSSLYGIALSDMLPGGFRAPALTLSQDEVLPPIDDETLKRFKTLSRREQELVMLLRACPEPDRLLAFARELLTFDED